MQQAVAHFGKAEDLQGLRHWQQMIHMEMHPVRQRAQIGFFIEWRDRMNVNSILSTA